ncbi:SDR family NAD(P)-dependent oxidoreductase [Heliobacterium chlorum]|uniref:SDR family NAD(P)-dependent oxidoreductase n=1 Tax=Heliobacterium chlorum TaxID=2698 RepID=A0ABR7T512_HELCL|nr:SDR family NAD(P)-dependent oxidoreductase [Heliobacterium chlorum]MBC9785167.1 SDR family NAD(P)-dependent oxidoreductase [Heliobacterium chlorum]
MNLSGNTVVITGGASGIGLALAERFIHAGNQVIICGRREEKLAEAKAKFPELHTRVCDLSEEREREALYQWVRENFPQTNLLINNAGIQQRVSLLEPNRDWTYYQQEIKINLEAPIHLSMLFMPLLSANKNATIINISSGLAFTPGAFAPIYSATKAALHSFSMSLRHQVSKSNIEVIEVAPPAVNTDLGGPGLHTFGVPLDEFADAVFQGLRNGNQEIGYGTSEKALRMSRDEIDKAFHQMNNRR